MCNDFNEKVPLNSEPTLLKIERNTGCFKKTSLYTISLKIIAGFILSTSCIFFCNCNNNEDIHYSHTIWSFSIWYIFVLQKNAR